MKRSALVLAAALAGCGGGPVATMPISTSERSWSGGGAATLLDAAGRSDAPGPEAVIAALGRPDVDRREGAGAMLAWRLPDCALALGFSTDRQGRLRLTFVQADPPRPGAPAPSHAQCAASAKARSGPTS